MNKYQGTQTEKNLQAAFAGESQARNKYTYFSSVAKKEGYEQIDQYIMALDYLFIIGAIEKNERGLLCYETDKFNC